jgi:lipopolysaccharide export system protein LptA
VKRHAEIYSLTAMFAVVTMLWTAASAAAEIELRDGTGDLIGQVADVVGAFKLTRLPAPLHVTADRMNFDYKGGRLAYEGNVDVSHGSVRLKSKSLVMMFESEDPGALKTIQASGDVEVFSDDEIARGQAAVYYPAKATLKLTGNATLSSGPNLVVGESVVIYLDEGRAIVEGGKRPVRAIIEPGSLDDEELLN